MPDANGAPILADLKARLRIGQGDAEDDPLLAQQLVAATTQVQTFTGHVYTPTTLTRVYTAWDSGRLLLPRGHDLLSVTTLVTDQDGDRVYETTWATTDYDLEPANNAGEQKPYWAICTRWQGNFAFPVGVAQGIRITGQWGWWTTWPGVAYEAVLLQCQLAYQNVNAAGGALSGAGEYTQSLLGVGLHPFVRRMLETDREGGAW